MMSLRDLEVLADEAAERAAEEGLQPYVPFDAEEVQEYGRGKRVPFPNLGSYRPQGWKLVDTLFVDSTGVGHEWEPALTVRAFREKLVEHLRKGHQYGYALIEEGQFQVVVGVFERAPLGKEYPMAGRRRKRPQAAARERRAPRRAKR